MAKKKTAQPAPSGPASAPTDAPPRHLDNPVFAQPQPTADPTSFRVHHASDGAAYKDIDELNKEHKLAPLPFPPPRVDDEAAEPILTLQAVLGSNQAAKEAISRLTKAGQIVFHSTGDCGSTKGPSSQNEVADKMVSDFEEADPKEVPSFNFLLGDVVYSFGESQYYFDQFYEPYREYPAPILAVAGNHDGMISPLAHAKSLDAFLRNFCSTGFTVTKEAGGLSRTAQVQPGVFFTFDAPFVRILALYSNTLEDPGVIADKNLGSSQLDFLEAALSRAKSEGYKGAILLAHHHPPYTVAHHGWSIDMQEQIDEVCDKVGLWPHADLAGHAHNYQRFTRTRANGQEIPYIVCGNGGHAVQKIKGALRAPQIVQKAGKKTDQVVLESYDDQNYGYLRMVVNPNQFRVEYHPASDGPHTKTADDAVTVDLALRKLVHYTANDLGRPAEAADVHEKRKKKHRANE
jgi:hypothetical protein